MISHSTLDATDLRLLDLLQTDASLTNQELAARVHVSPATCTAPREAAGRERRHRAARGAAVARHLGAGLTAMVEITLDRQGAEHLDAFEQRAVAEARGAAVLPRHRPGPISCWWCRRADMPAYHALVQRLFTRTRTCAT